MTCSILSFLLYSHFSFTPPPFFLFFIYSPLKYLYPLLRGPRTREVKGRGKRLASSIKDERHPKCIKRGDKHFSGGGGVSAGLMPGDIPRRRFTLGEKGTCFWGGQMGAARPRRESQYCLFHADLNLVLHLLRGLTRAWPASDIPQRWEEDRMSSCRWRRLYHGHERRPRVASSSGC